MLESYIKDRLKEKDILLMTHIVLGYPTFDESFKIVESMVEGGVDLMELQIPFSEPIADGPVILHANQKALEKGASVLRCLDFAQEVAGNFDIPFLFMSYYNILFKYGGFLSFGHHCSGGNMSYIPGQPLCRHLEKKVERRVFPNPAHVLLLRHQ